MCNRSKPLILFSISLVLILVLGWILYAIAGHKAVSFLYEHNSIRGLNQFYHLKTTMPLNYYLKRIDGSIFRLNIFLTLIVILTLGLNLLKKKHFFILLLSLFILYCGVFIYHSSFVYHGKRYFTLFDDAMISMRYAKNFAQGHGLVWNPGGERVEGYTNFLWTVYMAFWHLLPINASKITLPIQLTGLFFLLASLFLVKKITDSLSTENKTAGLFAVFLTASYLPINFWALRGMETSVLGFLLLLVIWRAFQSVDNKRFDPYLFGLLGIGILVRIDFALMFLAVSFFLFLVDADNRKKTLTVCASIFFLILGAQTTFRWFYYGNPLPNTYYLKVTGVPFLFRVRKGFSELSKFILRMSPILFALLYVYGFFKRKSIKILFLLYLFTIQILYSAYVGGDAWEWWGHLANRYICLVMPLFFILVSLCLQDVFALADGFFSRTSLREGVKNLLLSILVIIICFQAHGGFKNPKIISEELLKFSGLYLTEDKQDVQIGLELKKITKPDAVIGVSHAGSIPYYSERKCVDLLGKSDAIIAHSPAKISMYKEFHPGHSKYDYAYSIGKLQPDVIIRVWPKKEEALPFLRKYYRTTRLDTLEIYIRKDSDKVLL